MKYVHTNLIAKDWRRLSAFYQKVFACDPIPPERNLSGRWLDQATGIADAHIRGIHLRLPGCGPSGPTLEIFQYAGGPEHPKLQLNTPGFAHLAFAVEDVAAAARAVFAEGGKAVGELTRRKVAEVGLLTFQYVADPEGNIIEIQHWEADLAT